MAYKAAKVWNGSSFDDFGVQAVSTLNDYAKLTPSPSQTITNTTLTSPILNTPTITGGTSSSITLTSPQELTTVSATSATGTINYDCKTQAILYYTSNAGANFTLNFRGNSTTTLSSMLSIGQSMTASFLNTNGTSAYYPNAFQVDGTATGVTVRWSGGSAPASGSVSSVDAYTFTIIKTGSSTYSIFAGAVQFK